MRAIQRSDQKLWPFRTGTLVSSDDTSASPSSNSTSTPRKRTSGNSCKHLRAIQRSDQKLWPFRTSTLVGSDETSGTPRSDSTSTPRKTASGNSCENFRVIQRSDQKLWPFRTAPARGVRRRAVGRVLRHRRHVPGGCAGRGDRTVGSKVTALSNR